MDSTSEIKYNVVNKSQLHRKPSTKVNCGCK